MAFEALADLEAGRDPRPALLAMYPEKDVDELLSEIEELRTQGAILSEHDYSNLDIGKPGIVKAMCLHAAHDCNLRCRYLLCLHGRLPRRALAFASGNGQKGARLAGGPFRQPPPVGSGLLGGEPLMNYDVVHDLVLYARELEKKHAIISSSPSPPTAWVC